MDGDVRRSLMQMITPAAPEQGGKLVSRIRVSNWRRASAIRHHPRLGFIRLAIVGTRYFDRGAGGFMAGRGAWVTEGRVVCSSYPDIVDRRPRIPAVESVAGWGFIGSGPAAGAGGLSVEVGDRPATKPTVKRYERKFWTVAEAIAYANGDDDGDIARDTVPVKVRRIGDRYRLAIVEAPNW